MSILVYSEYPSSSHECPIESSLTSNQEGIFDLAGLSLSVSVNRRRHPIYVNHAFVKKNRYFAVIIVRQCS